MLSKSQARNFFLFATLGFSGVFLLLTVDSVYRVGGRSHAEDMTEQVVRGKEIWERNNCMGCHTILGEGAYYAPELTKVVERRGEVWLKLFLRDPEAMYPGRRRMVRYDWTDAEIDDVIAFLGWIGRIDTNGFPAAPDMAKGVVPAAAAATPPGRLAASADAATPAPPAAAPSALAAPPATPPATPPAAPAVVGEPPLLFRSVCVGCHSLGGAGGQVGPALDGVGLRYAASSMRAWLADPQGYKPGTAMPDLNLTDAQLDELTAFLMQQQ